MGRARRISRRGSRFSFGRIRAQYISYSLARAPADPMLQNVPRERLEEMAVAVRKALPRCIVEVF
jgi:hypothetical protein